MPPGETTGELKRNGEERKIVGALRVNGVKLKDIGGNKIRG